MTLSFEEGFEDSLFSLPMGSIINISDCETESEEGEPVPKLRRLGALGAFLEQQQQQPQQEKREAADEVPDTLLDTPTPDATPGSPTHGDGKDSLLQLPVALADDSQDSLLVAWDQPPPGVSHPFNQWFLFGQGDAPLDEGCISPATRFKESARPSDVMLEVVRTAVEASLEKAMSTSHALGLPLRFDLIGLWGGVDDSFEHHWNRLLVALPHLLFVASKAYFGICCDPVRRWVDPTFGHGGMTGNFRDGEMWLLFGGPVAGARSLEKALIEQHRHTILNRMPGGGGASPSSKATWFVYLCICRHDAVCCHGGA